MPLCSFSNADVPTYHWILLFDGWFQAYTCLFGIFLLISGHLVLLLHRTIMCFTSFWSINRTYLSNTVKLLCTFCCLTYNEVHVCCGLSMLYMTIIFVVISLMLGSVSNVSACFYFDRFISYCRKEYHHAKNHLFTGSYTSIQV